MTELANVTRSTNALAQIFTSAGFNAGIVSSGVNAMLFNLIAVVSNNWPKHEVIHLE